jgi:tetratricopeptide (TPR) repeat protein
LLDDAERAAFERLSVFAGGWTLEGAAAVCADGGLSASQVAPLVASLADKSMVVPPAPSGPARYGMLETLRLYGAERLDAGCEREPTSSAHARYFLALAEEAEIGLRGPLEREWVTRLRLELDNLRVAHMWCREHGDPELALRLSAALYRFACWQVNDEILSWAEAVVQLPSTQGHPLLPVVLGSAAVRRLNRGEMSTATSYAERALASCDGMDDLRRALPTEALGGICLLSGRLEEAFDHYGEAVRLWRLLGNDQGEVWCLCGRAVSAGKRGDLAAASALTKQARQVATSAGNPTMMANILYSEGESALEVDPVRALGPIGEALEFAQAADNVFMEGLALVSNTSLRGRHGDARVALRMFENVIGHWRHGGGWSQQWITLRNFVELLARQGAHEAAGVLYGACSASMASQPSYGPEVDRLEAVVRTLVSSLGERAFSDAKARGEALSDDEAVSFASAVTRRLLADAEQT